MITFEYIKQSLEQTFSVPIIVLSIAIVVFLLTFINYLHTRTQLKELTKITEQFKVDFVHEEQEHLINYVSFCKTLGYKDKIISSALRKVGWQDEQIKDAMHEVNSLLITKNKSLSK